MKITFTLAFITIIVGIIIYLYFRKKQIKNNMFLLLLTGVIAITILVYPLNNDYKIIYTRILASFFYALKCAGMGQNLGILSGINMNTTNGYIYFIFINLLFIIMPVITVGFILSFIENTYAKICLFFNKNNELHIFSEVNNKSILIAKKYKILKI